MGLEDIVPEIVDEVKSTNLTVTYPSGVSAQFGNELTPTTVKHQPTLKWGGKPNKLHLVALLDADAPSRAEPSARHVVHWLVGNITGEDISSGHVIAEFIGSGAPKGTGLHRYIFLVYEQNGSLNFDEPCTAKNSVANRVGFSIKDFTKKYSLSAPIAANFYNAQYDPYCDELKKQMVDM